MSYSWFRKGTCTTVNGSDVVRFTGADITTAPTKPVVGDAFTLDGVTLYEVIFIGSDSTGEYVRLEKAFPQPSVSNAKYAFMRLASSTQNAKLVAMAAAAINQKQISLDDMYEWYTSTADTVDFLGPDGTVVTLKTYHKLTKEISDVGGNTDAITIVSNNIDAVKDVHANMPAVKNVSDNMDEIKQVNLGTVGLSQSHFELIRAQNNEEFAASGFVHLGNHESGKEVSKFKPGLYTSLTTPNKLLLGKAGGVGGSKVDNAVINAAGVLFYLPNEFEIKFPQAPDGTVTYDKSNGEVKNHPDSATAFGYAGIDPANREVVTDRVDMWGFEPFLEEVSVAKPFIYNHGIINDAPATIDGIATSSSARPDTYYARFNGDTTSKGKGLNFFALSSANQKKVLSNPKHNLYYLDDGRLVQWRLRQRTIAGAGNGDWYNVDSTLSSLMFRNGRSFVVAQGSGDTVSTFADSGAARYIAPDNSANILGGKAEKGQFVPVTSAPAVNNECYFLVCGTVNRLNQGAYHPSFNPMGTNSIWHKDNSTDGKYPWYSTNAKQLTSKADSFKFGITNSSTAFVFSEHGNISSTISQRPDRRFYDAIYADGQGGVCRDMRYSANGVTPVDFDEADLRVKNGTYRGFEEIVKTQVKVTPVQTVTPSSGLVVSDPQAYEVGDSIHIVNPANEIVLSGKVVSVNSNTGFIGTNATYNREAVAYHVVITRKTSISVGGSFMSLDIAGRPSSIIQTNDLKDGWYGHFITAIPDGTNKEFSLARKSLSYVDAIYTLNNGSTWIETYNPPINEITNSFFNVMASNTVLVTYYQAFAKQTEFADNAPVYGGVVGVGKVRASSYNGTIGGCLLGESLTGNINKSANFSTVGPDSYIHEIQGLAMNVQAGKLIGVNNINSVHSALSIAAPQNNSPAYKALDYNVNINQQGFKQYAATELKHDSTDWGDDSKVTIVNGESTKTDLNGNTVKVVTHKMKEPIGWIKNKV